METRLRQSFAKQGLMRLFGAEMTSIAPGQVEISLEPKPELSQQHGFIHGGALTAIAEGFCSGETQKVVLRDALATLACPVQVIWGERDAIIPAEQAAGLPAAVRTEVLPGIGHLLHLEAANAVNALLLRQLG